MLRIKDIKATGDMPKQRCNVYILHVYTYILHVYTYCIRFLLFSVTKTLVSMNIKNMIRILLNRIILVYGNTSIWLCLVYHSS